MSIQAKDLHSRTGDLGEFICSKFLRLGPGKDKTKPWSGSGAGSAKVRRRKEIPLEQFTERQGNTALDQFVETSYGLSKGKKRLLNPFNKTTDKESKPLKERHTAVRFAFKSSAYHNVWGGGCR